MSISTQHHLMKPVLDQARVFDIATNPDPHAIFEAGSGGFQVWCTPNDHPRGWNGIQMISGTFSKPCEFVGSVIWKWDDQERIVALQIETSAYALRDRYPDKYTGHPLVNKRASIYNRSDDLKWLKKKVAWLFERAGVPLLPFECTPASK